MADALVVKCDSDCGVHPGVSGTEPANHMPSLTEGHLRYLTTPRPPPSLPSQAHVTVEKVGSLFAATYLVGNAAPC